MHSSITRRVAAPILIVVAVLVAACGATGPRDLGDLRVSVSNRSDRPIDVGARIDGEGLAGDGSTTIDPKGGGELISRLAPAWSITIGGRPFLTSDLRPDLVLVPGAPRRDLLVEVDVAPDGTVALKAVRFLAPGRPVADG